MTSGRILTCVRILEIRTLIAFKNEEHNRIRLLWAAGFRNFTIVAYAEHENRSIDDMVLRTLLFSSINLESVANVRNVCTDMCKD